MSCRGTIYEPSGDIDNPFMLLIDAPRVAGRPVRQVIIAVPLSATLWPLQCRTVNAESRLDYFTQNVSCISSTCICFYLHYTISTPLPALIHTTLSHHICAHFRIVEETTVPDSGLYMGDIVIDIYCIQYWGKPNKESERVFNISACHVHLAPPPRGSREPGELESHLTYYPPSYTA